MLEFVIQLFIVGILLTLCVLLGMFLFLMGMLVFDRALRLFETSMFDE